MKAMNRRQASLKFITNLFWGQASKRLIMVGMCVILYANISDAKWGLYKGRKAQAEAPKNDTNSFNPPKMTVQSVDARVSEIRFDIAQLKDDISKLQVEMESMLQQFEKLRTYLAKLSQTDTLLKRHIARLHKETESKRVAIQAIQNELKKRDLQSLALKTNSMLKANRYADVVSLLTPTLPKVPTTDPYHDRLLMNYAKGLFGTKSYTQAALKADDLEAFHPKSHLVPSAILLQGRSFLRLGRRTEAKVFFEELVRRYGSSREALTARKFIERLSTPPKSKKTNLGKK